MDAFDTPRKTILIVDDDSTNLKYLRTLLEAESYQTIEADNGDLAISLTFSEKPDLILLDAMMPGLDGFEVASRLKAFEASKRIPIIMVTALNDRVSRLRALQSGVEEFLTKPVDRSELWIRVRNLLRLKEYADRLADYNHKLELEVEARNQDLLSSHFDTTMTIMRAAEFRDEETGAHIKRISFYCKLLAEELGMDKEFIETIHYASPLHDVGKIGIPDNILLKPGKHDADEWLVMQSHASLGASILGHGRGNSPYTQMGAEIALTHHERWDGTGYPRGLAGEHIPLPGRIMAICDVYDALRSKRPYKPVYNHEETMGIILKGDGRTMPTHFDPAVIECFGNNAKVFNDIFETHQD